MKKDRSRVPSFDQLLNPTLQALQKLGGSASIPELIDAMVADLNLPDDIAEIPHPGHSSYTELGYRAAWARYYLKYSGLIDNSERGIWALTAEGAKTTSVDPKRLVRQVQRLRRNRRDQEESGGSSDSELEKLGWRELLIETLLSLEPTTFERLCQRLLREAGFIEVEVTRTSGDGGIDGYGTMRIGGLISFNVLFQSKRYRGNIGPDTVRDFRGAMVGRADKGLLITTGGFTREARREATRDGAPPIDLIDGDLLAEKLKELGLGVKIKLVEHVEINEEWFKAL